MKRYGLEQIKEVVPHGNEAFLVHTYKMMKKEKQKEFIKNLDGAIEFEMKEIKHLKPWAKGQREGIDDQRVELDSEDEASSDEDENQRRNNYLFSDEEDLAVPIVGRRKDSGMMELDDETEPSKRAKDFEQEVEKIFNPKQGRLQSHFIDHQEAGFKGKRESSVKRKQEAREMEERDIVFDQEKNKFIISENKGSQLLGKRTKTTDEDEEGNGQEG